ncbi:protein of unknown function [Pseudorhizobium banfieldiae]|uniref:Uncharacterized protein n=1 Tax=Pseudorhizobium banfieldiae TaxID=1125847 RepID=L0NE19_9HYPH|nr:hypothetical protein [Pseudorhizobium banfieldiae]CAD6606074.1 hypothetical protein RNT25_01778 [arsenite-oxidising bacterium NT-25]CCF19124.1 protein of unknown function [Pseudorhizobium banfieldiae]
MTIDRETLLNLVQKIVAEHESGYDDDTLVHFAEVILTKPEPERFANRRTYTYAQVEGALCVYEWMLDSRATNKDIDDWFDGVGSPGMRMISIQAGDICDRAWKLMEAMGFDFIGAYDFEFVPSICAKLDWDALCNDNQFDKGRYDPDLKPFIVAMIAADRSRNSDPMRRNFKKVGPGPDDYIAACRAEAEKQWGYGDLVTDHAERVTQAMEQDEDPAEFVKWLGEKYNLTPRSDWAA